jgi:hypothetical protein
MARVPVLAGDAARGSGGPVGLDRAAGGGTGGPATSSLVTAGVMLHTEAPGPHGAPELGVCKNYRPGRRGAAATVWARSRLPRRHEAEVHAKRPNSLVLGAGPAAELVTLAG